MPNGVWETTDYIDVDPAKGEGMIPIHVKMTIDGDHVHYDLSGSHPTTISTFLNCCFGGAFAAIVAGTKMQSPDIPLNSGFYRVVTVDLGPEGLGRQCRVADAGRRLLLGTVREDHELGLRVVGGSSARAAPWPVRSISNIC